MPVFESLWVAGCRAKARYGVDWDRKVRLKEVAGGWTWEKRRPW